MEENKKVLEVVAETEILGKNIKLYGSIEEPYFVARDVADWLLKQISHSISVRTRQALNQKVVPYQGLRWILVIL